MCGLESFLCCRWSHSHSSYRTEFGRSRYQSGAQASCSGGKSENKSHFAEALDKSQDLPEMRRIQASFTLICVLLASLL